MKLNEILKEYNGDYGRSDPYDDPWYHQRDDEDFQMLTDFLNDHPEIQFSEDQQERWNTFTTELENEDM